VTVQKLPTYAYLDRGVMVNDLLPIKHMLPQGLVTPATTRESSWEEPMGNPEFGVITVYLLIVGVVLCYSALATGGIFP
jgi:hypothetical protein